MNETRARKVPVAKEFSRASVWDDQAVDGLHALHDERTEKVRTEWSLITLAYNLKRVLNLVSVEKLIAAVR